MKLSENKINIHLSVIDGGYGSGYDVPRSQDRELDRLDLLVRCRRKRLVQIPNGRHFVI